MQTCHELCSLDEVRVQLPDGYVYDGYAALQVETEIESFELGQPNRQQRQHSRQEVAESSHSSESILVVPSSRIFHAHYGDSDDEEKKYPHGVLLRTHASEKSPMKGTHDDTDESHKVLSSCSGSTRSDSNSRVRPCRDRSLSFEKHDPKPLVSFVIDGRIEFSGHKNALAHSRNVSESLTPTNTPMSDESDSRSNTESPERDLSVLPSAIQARIINDGRKTESSWQPEGIVSKPLKIERNSSVKARRHSLSAAQTPDDVNRSLFLRRASDFSSREEDLSSSLEDSPFFSAEVTLQHVLPHFPQGSLSSTAAESTAHSSEGSLLYEDSSLFVPSKSLKEVGFSLAVKHAFDASNQESLDTSDEYGSQEDSRAIPEGISFLRRASAPVVYIPSDETDTASSSSSGMDANPSFCCLYKGARIIRQRSNSVYSALHKDHRVEAKFHRYVEGDEIPPDAYTPASSPTKSTSSVLSDPRFLSFSRSLRREENLENFVKRLRDLSEDRDSSLQENDEISKHGL